MVKASIFSALGLLAGLFISACGTSSSSNNNDNRPKTDEQICQENPNSRACDNLRNDDADEARWDRRGYDDERGYYDYGDDGYYRDDNYRGGDGYYDDGYYVPAEPRGCQVASRTIVDRSDNVYVGIKKKKGRDGKTKKSFEAHVGSTRDSFSDHYSGCSMSAVINTKSNVTCKIHADCEGLPVEGQMIDAYCDNQGYCRID